MLPGEFYLYHSKATTRTCPRAGIRREMAARSEGKRGFQVSRMSKRASLTSLPCLSRVINTLRPLQFLSSVCAASALYPLPHVSQLAAPTPRFISASGCYNGLSGTVKHKQFRCRDRSLDTESAVRVVRAIPSPGHAPDNHWPRLQRTVQLLWSSWLIMSGSHAPALLGDNLLPLRVSPHASLSAVAQKLGSSQTTPAPSRRV